MVLETPAPNKCHVFFFIFFTPSLICNCKDARSSLQSPRAKKETKPWLSIDAFVAFDSLKFMFAVASAAV